MTSLTLPMRRVLKLSNSRYIEITVALWIDEDAEVSDVISEMNYKFTHPAIQETEIKDINTEI
jgi:hypothetical protein